MLEQDFSFKSYFELFERMGDWCALSKVCEGQVDTKEDFWKDEWSLDTLLPHMMKATCRQVLNGSDECQEFLKVHYICHHLGRFFFVIMLSLIDNRAMGPQSGKSRSFEFTFRRGTHDDAHGRRSIQSRPCVCRPQTSVIPVRMAKFSSAFTKSANIETALDSNGCRNAYMLKNAR